MLFNGVKEYSKDGNEFKTAMVVGNATRDGELKTTQNGKTYGAVGVRAFGRQDGTAAFIEVKSFRDTFSKLIAALNKGDVFMAAGRLETREYNDKTYTDLLADIVVTGTPASLEANKAEIQRQATGAFLLDEEEEPGELPF